MKDRSPLRLSWQNGRLDKLALVSVVLIGELGRMEVDYGSFTKEKIR